MDHRVLIQEGRTHRLLVKESTPLDAGIYQCRVKDQVTECEVTVQGEIFFYLFIFCFFTFLINKLIRNKFLLY